jgi:hypothetical protein
MVVSCSGFVLRFLPCDVPFPFYEGGLYLLLGVGASRDLESDDGSVMNWDQFQCRIGIPSQR